MSSLPIKYTCFASKMNTHSDRQMNAYLTVRAQFNLISCWVHLLVSAIVPEYSLISADARNALTCLVLLQMMRKKDEEAAPLQRR